MNGQELRLGNLVFFENKAVIVSAINSEDGNELDLYSPIPITEEWLLKFGFLKSDNYGNDEYRINGYSYFRGSFYISDCDECGESVEIDFVHELQNLYFALTKQELKLI